MVATQELEYVTLLHPQTGSHRVMHIAVESISVVSMQYKLFVIGGLTHVSSLLHEIINKQIAKLKKSNLIILNMVLIKKK